MKTNGLEQRHEMYVGPHKALRALFFEVATEVARSDFSLRSEAGSAAEAVRVLLDELSSHAEHEDAVILPELAVLAPELHQALAADHTRTEGLEHELSATAERLEAASEAERVSLGSRMVRQVNALLAEHLRHMAVEEGEAQRILWAHRTDEELAALVDRIMAMDPPPQVAAFVARMLQAMNRSERRATLAQARAKLPAEVFEALTAPAREALGPELFADALREDVPAGRAA